MVETVGIEIGARQLTDAAFAGVVRNIETMTGAAQQGARGVADLALSADKARVALIAGGLVGAVSMAANELMKYHARVRESVGAMVDQADAINLTTSQFQALSFAADGVGVSQEKMSGAVAVFNTKMGEADRGNKTAIESFGRLGIKLLDANGALRDNTTVMGEAARAILAMEDGSKRAAAAKDVFGLSGRRLVPLLREMAQGIGELEARAKAAGVVIDSDLAAKVNALNNQSNAAGLAIRAFYAEIGMPIELSALLLLEKTVRGIVGLYRDGMGAAIQFGAAAGTALRQNNVDDLEKKLKGVDDAIASTHPGWAKRIEGLKSQRTVIQQQLDETRAVVEAYETKVGRFMLGRQLGSPDEPPPVTRSSFGGDKPPRVTGSGGGDKRDRIQEAINQLQGETKAAQDAYRQMMSGAGVPLKELERQVALEKKIADEIAKLGKYDPKDPRVAGIRDLVVQHENAEASLRNYLVAARDAEQIEKASGDGRAFLREETKRLSDALDTGRLSYAAYSVAMKDASEKADDMRLKMIGQQGGVEGLAAGMEYAARQWQRNNTAFAQGQRIFEATVDSMNQALSDWVTKGEFNFQRFLGSFLMMIAQMEMRAAASQIWGALGGASGLFGSLFGGGGQVGGYTLAGNTAGQGISGLGNLGFAGMYAEGGRPPVGMASIVGERGPELFVPDVAGTIVPNGGFPSGGGSVVVHQTVHVGAYVTRTEHAQGLMATKAAAEQGAINGLLGMRRRGDTRVKGVF